MPRESFHPPDVQESDASASRGWFKAVRGDEAIELIRLNPNAFTLAYIIAWRSRYHDGFNADGISLGEAMLGDYKACGMSERQYRTAKEQLQKWNFATFKATNKGTIGKLTDTRLFDPLNLVGDEQNDRQPTGDRRAADERPTTNKEGKKGINNAHTHLAEIPTWDEVKTEAQMRGVLESSAKSFYDHHENNSLWQNQYGRIINWKAKLITWAAKDRQPKGNHHASQSPISPVRNAGTENANSVASRSFIPD